MSTDIDWPADREFKPYGIIYDPVTGFCPMAFTTVEQCDQQVAIWKRRPRYYTRIGRRSPVPYGEMVLRFRGRQVNSTDEVREILRHNRELVERWTKDTE